MEKPHINFSVQRILSLLRVMAGSTMNAGMLWRIIIGSVCCAALALFIFAYFTYMWAINTELPQTITTKDRNAFLLTDLKKVITLYQSKEETYNRLLHTRPEAPFYAKGKGVVLTPPPEALQNVVDTSASGTVPLAPGVKGTSVLP